MVSGDKAYLGLTDSDGSVLVCVQFIKDLIDELQAEMVYVALQVLQKLLIVNKTQILDVKHIEYDIDLAIHHIYPCIFYRLFKLLRVHLLVIIGV